METLEFLPLQIRKAALAGKGALRYRVIGQNGQSVVVDADSAAEAMIKSGVTNAAKIVNLDVEDNVLGSELQKDGQTVPTSISHDEHGRAKFFAAELPEHPQAEAEGFMAFSLGEMAGQTKGAAPAAEPAPAPVPPPAEPPHVFVPPTLPEEAVVVPEEPAMEAMEPGPVIPPPVEAEILPPLNATELSAVETAMPMAEPVPQAPAAPAFPVPDRELTPEEIRKLLEE